MKNVAITIAVGADPELYRLYIERRHVKRISGKAKVRTHSQFVRAAATRGIAAVAGSQTRA